MQADIDEIVATTSIPAGVTFYHEVDETLFSASSNSFIGQIYGLLGLTNIADEADTTGRLSAALLGVHRQPGPRHDLPRRRRLRGDTGKPQRAAGMGRDDRCPERGHRPLGRLSRLELGPRVVELLE